jgi:hypothetical protein
MESRATNKHSSLASVLKMDFSQNNDLKLRWKIDNQATSFDSLNSQFGAYCLMLIHSLVDKKAYRRKSYTVYIDWSWGLSPIGPGRENQPRFYLLYFICSDDKIFSRRPDSYYGVQILEGLGEFEFSGSLHYPHVFYALKHINL